MGKKHLSRFAGLAILFCGLIGLAAGPAQAADPVVNPGTGFAATVTGGEIKIGSSLDPIDVGTMSPSPRLKNIEVNADGSFSAAATDFTFPQLTLSVDSPVGAVDIFVQIRAASPVTGSINPVTGEVSLSTDLTIQLTSNHAIVALGNNCYVGTPASPIPFSASSDTTGGVPYDEYPATATVVDDTLAIPAASGCPTIVGQDVNQIVNSTMGLPSPSGENKATLAMRFNPAPHSENWVDPNGPDDIPPTIVNDTNVEVDTGVLQRSWLESGTISDNTVDDGLGTVTGAGRDGNTIRITLLVKHNPGRQVTGVRVDDNWDASDDADGSAIKPVTEEQPAVVGGFNYSRVTFAYQAPSAGMGLTCPGLFDSNQGVQARTAQISVRAVLDNGDESDTSVSAIKLTREDCNNKFDPPLLYGWQDQDPAGPITPGTEVAFRFRGIDTDEGLTSQQKFGGYTWRLRNLDTGETTTPTQVCPGTNLDGVLRTLNVTFPKRGRWVVEAQLLDMANDLFDNQGCVDPLSGNFWSWIGAVDVNSPAEIANVRSPGASLALPARPGTDNTITASVETSDPFDVPNDAGGLTQSVEWDIDGDNSNGVDGFDLARLGDSRTGLTEGQNQILIDTSEMAPGFHVVRVRVGDNGALGATDDIRRTNIATGQFMVNTPPVADDLSVSTDEGESVTTPLVASDTNADGSHDPLSWSLTTAPSHGFISGEWPNRVYHPEEGFHGNDSFIYSVSDGYGGSDTGTVSIAVNQVDNPVDPPPPPDVGPEKQALKADFEEGRINLNEGAGPATSGIRVVDSTVPDPPVVLDTKHWDKASGEILAPPEDLAFPAKTVSLIITDPLPLELDVTIEFGATGNIGGSFDPDTGAMVLDFDAHALITVNAPAPLGEVLKCDVTPIPLKLSTSGADLVDPGDGGSRPAATWSASAFDTSGEGAVTSLWNTLPASTPLAEPMAPLATCGDTLDGLIGGKGGFWLGGKVTFDGSANPDPDGGNKGIPKGVALFDGKRLHIRLYCPKIFKPSCKSTSVPVTKKVSRKAGKKAKSKSKPMAKSVRSKIRSGNWKKVSYLIKPKYRAKVRKMVGKPKRLLVIRQTVKAKKMGRKKMKKGKSRTFFHKHKVRAG